ANHYYNLDSAQRDASINPDRFMKTVTPLLLVISLAFISCNQNMKEAKPAIPLPPGVQKTFTGLKHKLLRPGKIGPTPNSLSTVTVHYEGKSKDGKIFDSSYKRGKPAEFPLAQVIQGWTEGLQLMTKGEKRRFWIPANLAYGENPRTGQPGGELTFEIELLDFHQ
ncbi:FKBP-type peptidyl-prolyl cis-trans isomerase, partial [Akkermansiaceae bacterium]|nr:FKBP-type peptidyl-prolyl cis-trans isomerase [Akkermansiaceae bacterium]